MLWQLLVYILWAVQKYQHFLKYKTLEKWKNVKSCNFQQLIDQTDSILGFQQLT